MDIVTNLFSSIYSNTVPFVVLLGALIFVHELGHFLVAKYYKVKVEVFSLGFGKKILQYKYGDTVYCLSIIPLGGYVKLYGDDPRADIPDENRAVSFLHKPLWPRIAVVLAGPMMNFFFAIFVFAVVALMGDIQVEPQIGDLSQSSAAYTAGFRPGDSITFVNNVKVKSWKHFTDFLEDRAGQSIAVKVLSPDGTERILNITPELQDNNDLLSFKRKIGTIPGITNASLSTSIGIINDQSVAALAGLKTHDIITKVNQKSVNTWRDLFANVDVFKNDGTLDLEVDRYSEDASQKETLTFKLSVSSEAAGADNTLLVLGIESAELYLSKVVQDSPAQRAGIKKNDKIISINGKNFTRWLDVLESIRSYKADTGSLNFVVLRNNTPVELEIRPEITQQQGAHGQQEKRFTVGIAPTLSLEVVPPTTLAKAESFGEALVSGWDQTIWWTKATFAVFAKIFERKISPRNIGGIISIQQAAKKTFDFGMSVFIKMMGILSVNLFVMNLLPIPVLDGGHLVFYLIELIKGAPLSVRKMELATQVGLFLLFSLMIFAIFNDISMVFKLNW